VTAPRDFERPLPLGRAARLVFDFALEGMAWSRRSLVMAVLVGLPALFAVLYRFLLAAGRLSDAPAPMDFYGQVIALYEVRNVLPLVAFFYASALVADEVEGKTLTYLLTRPIPRAAVLVGKFGAYLVTGLSIALPVTVACFLVLATGARGAGLAASAADLFRDLGAVALTLLAYGALFALMGVVFRRPVIPGLLFLFGWELTANLPGYMPRLTLTAYLRSLLHFHPPQEGLFPVVAETFPWTTAVGTLLGASALFLGVAVWIFSRREYLLEQ
jgi:ABC-2 type transport system permease protein